MKKNNTDVSQPVRVALYIRVSGEEQKIKGLSLEAQQERLEQYAREHGWIITGIYVDAAKTARKNIHKRIEFQRMIESVKRDEVDILLFCRLDRWFRSVADYYKVMEILSAHNCEWKTTDEEYDTTTANGRLYINVKLSIAQNEADIDGERIDVVFDSKIAHGTVLSGRIPFGYRINEEKRLEIIPENADIIREIYNYYETTASQGATVKYIRMKYGLNWHYETFRYILHEKLYTGVYDRKGRRNDNFCPAIISKEQYERVQTLTKRNARLTPASRIYIFSSLLICDECGYRLVGKWEKKDYYYYRCNQHFRHGACCHNKQIREEKIEEWLIKNLKDEINSYKTNWEIKAAEKKSNAARSDKAVLKRKLSKLKELYINDLINIEDYKKDYIAYTTALQQIPEITHLKPPDFSSIENMLSQDFKALYNTFSREEKRTLWRSVIKEIRIDAENNITGISFD